MKIRQLKSQFGYCHFWTHCLKRVFFCSYKNWETKKESPAECRSRGSRIKPFNAFKLSWIKFNASYSIIDTLKMWKERHRDRWKKKIVFVVNIWWGFSLWYVYSRCRATMEQCTRRYEQKDACNGLKITWCAIDLPTNGKRCCMFALLRQFHWCFPLKKLNDDR